MNTKIISAINEYVAKYKKIKGTETEWREPVIGFADAKNPLFADLKKVISPSHSLPSDLMTSAKFVIVFFLPFSEEIISSNIGKFQSSRAWDIAKIETNNLIGDLYIRLNEVIKKEGYDSTTPSAASNYDSELLISDWSHRHVAYIAAVGTFGIHNLLITKQGCCGRIGSVITTMPLEPTITSINENCLFKYNASCGECAKKCVANAISPHNGYPYVNLILCDKQILDDCIPEYDIGIGDACGKCMSGVPCSTKNPCEELHKINK